MVKSTDSRTLSFEVRLAIRQRLGSEYPASKITKVQRIQKNLLARKAEMDSSLYRRELTGEKFAIEVNEAVNESLRDCVESLGEEDYVRFMELEPGEKVVIVVPETAAEAHAEPNR